MPQVDDEVGFLGGDGVGEDRGDGVAEFVVVGGLEVRVGDDGDVFVGGVGEEVACQRVVAGVPYRGGVAVGWVRL